MIKLRRMKFLYHTNNLLSIMNDNCLKNNFIQLRTLQLTVNCKSKKKLINNNLESKKKMKEETYLPQIMLIQPDGSKNVVLMEDALKIAKRRSMYLFKMPDMYNEGSKHVYRIVNHATYINSLTNKMEVKLDDNKVAKGITKSTKNFTLTSKIFQNDLDIKLNNINKLLKRKHKIIIVVTESGNNKITEVVEYIKKSINGVMQAEQTKKQNVILTFSPSNDENVDKDDS